MDISQLGALIVAHKWIPVAALIIGLIGRYMKSDTSFPPPSWAIPPRVRVWFVFALGLAGGVLEHVSNGKSWEQAIVDGLLASVFAIIGHNVIVDSIRGGKELPVPGVIPGALPSTNKATLSPPTVPPAA